MLWERSQIVPGLAYIWTRNFKRSLKVFVCLELKTLNLKSFSPAAEVNNSRFSVFFFNSIFAKILPFDEKSST